MALLCLWSSLDTTLRVEQPEDVVEFGGGLIGALAIVLLGLAIRGIAWLFYQITKDSIDNEEDKTSFWRGSTLWTPENLMMLFWP